jgi:hypothetical protein
MRLHVSAPVPVFALLLLATACGSDPAVVGGSSPGTVLDDGGGDGVDLDVGEADTSGGLDSSAEPDAPITLNDVTVTPSDAAPDDAIDEIITRPDTIGREDTAPAEDTAPGEDAAPAPDSGPAEPGICCDPACETRCDLGTQECCIDVGAGGASSCVEAGACETGVTAACDGPEDCDGGGICCVAGTVGLGGGTETDIAATCADSCEYAVELTGGAIQTTACHSPSDCAEGRSCCSASVSPASLCLEGFAVTAIGFAGGTCEDP